MSSEVQVQRIMSATFVDAAEAERAMKTDLSGIVTVAGQRGGHAHLGTIPLQIVQLVAKLFRCVIDFAKNFTDQGTGLVVAWMMGHGRRSAIRMTVKHVAAFLPGIFETQSKQDLLHGLAVNDGQSAHPATSICCKPINRGRFSPASRYSSRHNSRTSFRFFCSSSKLFPWMCAPGIPGTNPTYSLVSGSHSKYAVKVLIQHLKVPKGLHRLAHDSRYHEISGGPLREDCASRLWESGLSGEIAYHDYGGATYPINQAFSAFVPFGVIPPDPRVGSYNLLNMRTGYRFWQQKAAAGHMRDAEVAVSVLNALNDEHKEHPLGDLIGRRVMGVTLKF